MAVAWPRKVLGRLAAQDDLAVFVAAGKNAGPKYDAFFDQDGARRVSSPRHAQALLVLGFVPSSLHQALHRLHDQLPHPRISIWWGTAAPSMLRDSAITLSDDVPAPDPLSIAARVFAHDYASEEPLLEDQPPAPWRGLGDHGQGGEGMMGGKPYGRPMAMTGPDLRDGLQLDSQTVHIGPFLPGLPAGLKLALTLQGDVIQEIVSCRPPFPLDDSLLQPFLRATSEPVPIINLERLRAASHLDHIARYLCLCELSALAQHFAKTARQLRGGARITSLGVLQRALDRSAGLKASAPGFGQVDGALLSSLSGPASRASGRRSDLRSGEASYQALRFSPVSQNDGDVRARITQWMEEAVGSLKLAEAAARDQRSSITSAQAVESPAGPLSSAKETEKHSPDSEASVEPSPAFRRLLAGMEWNEALLFLASFDSMNLRRMLTGESV